MQNDQRQPDSSEPVEPTVEVMYTDHGGEG